MRWNKTVSSLPLPITANYGKHSKVQHEHIKAKGSSPRTTLGTTSSKLHLGFSVLRNEGKNNEHFQVKEKINLTIRKLYNET